MSDDGKWVWLGVGAALGFAIAVAESRNAPCVYKHSAVVDFFFDNGEKRTCKALLTESNVRIEGQQAQLKEAADAIERLNNKIHNEAAQETVPAVGIAPTVSPLVAETEAHSAPDDDDD